MHDPPIPGIKPMKLPKKEKCALMYLDFNPNILLILDDCASKFKKWYKKTNVIK